MKKNQKVFWAVLALALIFCCQAVQAEVKMPAVFASHMVLQRDLDTPIWGWAAATETVTITVAGQTKKATAEADGKWFVRLDPVKAGGPYTMTVTGTKNKIVFDDVLFGDVWLCSGQSNMGFTVNRSVNAEKEIAAANFPNIRLLRIQTTSKALPQTDVQVTPWAACTPKNVPSFTAVGFYFGRKLYQELNIPIGLINCSWGGSTCEAWVNEKVLAGYPDLAPLVDPKQIDKTKPHKKATYLYNGMIVPIRPFGIKGVIWYQGESNAGRAAQHDIMFPVMIQNWRDEWQQGDFPFYFVQLANYMKIKDAPGDSAWAELRESQSRALACRNTGEAVTIDIGEANDIHPKNKQDVGLRLAAWALAKDYGKNVPYSGPRLRDMKIDGDKAVVSFDFVGTGLVAKGAKPNEDVKGFAMAGADRKFYWAKATVKGDTIVVSCPEVKRPWAVRYAWADNPICNLYNKEGFPACPFRTDLAPRITETAR
ncbi:MAG: sialate O-acetylesterase [Thermoguttaceae bacterium]|nr:sialate O-acetylesterase [Thermoguttaceae bacterium]